MNDAILGILTDEEKNVLRLSELTQDESKIIESLLMRFYSIGSDSAPKVDDIEEVEFDGKLITLQDGSKWKVEDYDAGTSDMWSYLDKIVIYEDEMYKLDDLEKVTVSEYE